MGPLKLISLFLGAVLFWGVGGAGIAAAAGESVAIETSLNPRGKLYKEVRKPVNATFKVEVTTPPSSPTVNPLKRVVLRFPRDMTYNPNNRRTPVCTDRQLDRGDNLAAGVAAIVSRCPRSVIGTGTAAIYIAKVNAPQALVTDPQMVIFNGGRDRKGNPRMKIYAFSRTTNVGILMWGKLNRRGVQNVFVPVLSNDSAVKNFVFNLPGSGMTVEDSSAPGGTRTIRGLDPKYVRARCSSGRWVTGGTFTMGERAYPSGTPTGPSTLVQAQPYTDQCQGLRGRPRLAKAKARGPKWLRRGSRKIFRVWVRNTGTATAKRVRVFVKGSARGRARTANIKPGKWRKMRVRVRVTGRKGSRAKIVFQIRANGAAARTVAWGRILR